MGESGSSDKATDANMSLSPPSKQNQAARSGVRYALLKDWIEERNAAAGASIAPCKIEEALPSATASGCTGSPLQATVARAPSPAARRANCLLASQGERRRKGNTAASSRRGARRRGCGARRPPPLLAATAQAGRLRLRCSPERVGRGGGLCSTSQCADPAGVLAVGDALARGHWPPERRGRRTMAAAPGGGKAWPGRSPEPCPPGRRSGAGRRAHGSAVDKRRRCARRSPPPLAAAAAATGKRDGAGRMRAGLAPHRCAPPFAPCRPPARARRPPPWPELEGRALDVGEGREDVRAPPWSGGRGGCWD
ncbi:hypothetical protein PVAP13_9NG319514 [Panicum virgatum]|uniref:Uncharacterized protein n=1 Tax=Panicum virgatum TaxID=38727 RepID=A0A8T0MPX1_PANVG|nr:hypothetical protein PVAP13_9NG319514 [Panicum virgatum]